MHHGVHHFVYKARVFLPGFIATFLSVAFHRSFGSLGHCTWEAHLQVFAGLVFPVSPISGSPRNVSVCLPWEILDHLILRCVSWLYKQLFIHANTLSFLQYFSVLRIGGVVDFCQGTRCCRKPSGS